MRAAIFVFFFFPSQQFDGFSLPPDTKYMYMESMNNREFTEEKHALNLK